MRITNDPESLKRILCYIEATVVLHNMLIELGAVTAGADWDVSDELTALDDENRVPEEYHLFEPVEEYLPKGTRRDQLKEYMFDHWDPNYAYRPIIDRDDEESSLSSTSVR